MVGTLLVLTFLSFIAFRSYRGSEDFLRSMISSITLYINSFALVAAVSGSRSTLIAMEILSLASVIYTLIVTSKKRLVLNLLLVAAFTTLLLKIGLPQALAAGIFQSYLLILGINPIWASLMTTLLSLSFFSVPLEIPLYVGVGWIGSMKIREELKGERILRKTEWITLLHAGVFSAVSYITSFFSETAAMILMFLFLYMATLYAIKSLERERTSSKIQLEGASRTLEDVVSSILSFDLSKPLDEYLQQILESAASLIDGVEGGSIELKERGMYRFKAALNFDLRKLKNVYFTEEEMVHYDRPMVIRHASSSEEGAGERRKIEKLEGLIPKDIKVTLICPLKVGGEFYGAIFLDNFTDENAFNEHDAETIEIFGRLASLFLEMKLREQEIEAMSKRLGLLVKLGGEGLLASDRSTVYWKAYEIVKDLYGDVLNLFVWTEPHEGMWTGVAIDRYGNTISLSVPEGEGVMSEVMKEGRTKVVHDVSKNPKFYEIIPGSGSMIGVPIHYRGSFFGGLDIEITEKNYFKDEDVIFFEDLASALGLIFKYYENVEKVENLYYSVIKALASAVDMKDPYTYGHSDRVAYYSLGIAKAMGLKGKEMENLKYGATLHDIGKIGIPHEILNKRGRLTDEEMEVIRSHTVLGYSTVRDIPDFKDVAGIIKWHHEQ